MKNITSVALFFLVPFLCLLIAIAKPSSYTRNCPRTPIIALNSIGRAYRFYQKLFNLTEMQFSHSNLHVHLQSLFLAPNTIQPMGMNCHTTMSLCVHETFLDHQEFLPPPIFSHPSICSLSSYLTLHASNSL